MIGLDVMIGERHIFHPAYLEASSQNKILSCVLCTVSTCLFINLAILSTYLAAVKITWKLDEKVAGRLFCSFSRICSYTLFYGSDVSV